MNTLMKVALVIGAFFAVRIITMIYVMIKECKKQDN